MKLIMILTTVLTIAACSKGGGTADGSVSAQGLTGSYAVKAVRPNGDVVMIFATFSAGQYEVSDYKYIGGDMSKASFVKWTSLDDVSGDTHNITLIHATCPTLNGIVAPTTFSFPVTPLSGGQILLHSDTLNGDVLMDKIVSVEQDLADLGTYLSLEVTDCSLAF